MVEEGEESSSDSELPKVTMRRSSEPYDWVTKFPRDLMAGAVMGGLVHTIVAPIERAKLLLQTQESNAAIVSGPHRRFKGMVDCIVHTVREEGISLWRGNGSSVIRYYPSVALNFSLKLDGELYILATGKGYLNEVDVVWEKLTKVWPAIGNCSSATRSTTYCKQ